MIYTIPAGRHRAWPFWLWAWWNKNRFVHTIEFTESCRYNLRTDDQGDINKLSGFGYLRGWFRPAGVKKWQLWKYHHKDGARWGWRYDIDMGVWELYAYCYVDGKREVKQVAFCEVGKKYRLVLSLMFHHYWFTCYELTSDGEKQIGDVWIGANPSKNFMYRQGIYFGGDMPAPHKMKIKMK